MRQKPTVLSREIVASSRLFGLKLCNCALPTAMSAPMSGW